MEEVEVSLISQEILNILSNSCTIDTEILEYDFEFVHADFTLNWQKIMELCDPLEDFSYENCKKIISLHEKVWKEAFSILSGSELANIPPNLYLWTLRSDFIEKVLCINLLDASKSVEVTLILSSVIEYALGNVFFTVSGKNPPHLLRDILATEELVRVFGKNRLFFLQILMGTPNGINLRNIVWHGFPASHEIPLYYPCVLLLVIFSFGRILKDMQIKPRKLSYDPVEMIDSRIQIDTSWTEMESGKILTCLKSSSFISANHYVFWEEILQSFSTKNYSTGIILFLPQFELVLRRIYGQVNGVDIRAKIGHFYIILDTFMEEFTPDGGSINQIVRIFNPGILHLIYDLFMAPKGPRIRDKISHGELSLQEIESKELLEKLISLLLGVLSQIPEHSLVKDLCTPLWTYRSVFHPNGRLLINLESLRNTRNKLKEIILEIPFDFDINMSLTDDFPALKFHVKDLKIFFRPPEECEIVGILNNILTNTLTSWENLSGGLQERLSMFKAKLLRSKRRQTLRKCIQLLPKINSWLLSLFDMIQDVFTLMQQSVDFWKTAQRDTLKRLLRKIQKYSENLTQSTQMSSNDWIKSTAAVDKSVETLTKVMHLFDLNR